MGQTSELREANKLTKPYGYIILKRGEWYEVRPIHGTEVVDSCGAIEDAIGSVIARSKQKA